MNNLFFFLQSKGVDYQSIINKKVIDIGGGNGSETFTFKENGFEVTLIDLKNGIDATTYIYGEEKFDIAIAKNSLPFMKESQMDVMANVYKALKKGGYFYGTVFGKDDPWAKAGLVTSLDFPSVLGFLEEIGFRMIWQCEEKGVGKTMKGDYKDWHILKFLIRK